ncbi:MAG: DUF4876 domain-containing protein [Pedobacter sp.]|nr:MAG: DUF4876 domain-containing protein [Pedobacter sp.]
MKKYLLFLLMAAGFSACKKEETTAIKPLDVNVAVTYNLSANTYSLPLNKVKVKFTNVSTKVSREFDVPDNGIVTVNQLSPGFYDIDASVTLSASEYTAITNIPVEKEVTFNASIKNKQITVDFAEPLNLTLATGFTGDWVIKQVYYAGSDRINGALYRDQFIEFYNNSDKVLYADGLLFAETVGIVSRTSAASYHLTSTGQMDWTKSQNMPSNIDANNDYIYARALLQIPGNGNQYPVQPGKSIVVAQTALNHKSPFIGNDGKSVSVLDPTLTVDLSTADFEAYYAPLLARPLASDIDNPNVPNLNVLSFFGNDMLFDNPGRYSYALIKMEDGVDPNTLGQYPYPTKATPSSSATKYFQIPNKYVIDAVEVQPLEADDRIPKKYNTTLDAGFTYVPKGSYTSQSIIRKTEKTVNGRIILKDTNNSTEDFTFLDIASPRGFK